MKALIEEASSIAKAIEKAWERAGNPQSFSIKIFELPEKNFIGMTTKYAKVGLFFEEKYTNAVNKVVSTIKKEVEQSSARLGPKQPKQNQKYQPETTREQSQIPFSKERKNERATDQRQIQRNKPAERSSVNAQPPVEVNAAEGTPITATTWQPEMLTAVQHWLRKTLDLIELSNVDFTMHDDKQLLKINFDSPLVGNELKESIIYKNISYLVMTSLRAHFKSDMKNLKIVLGRE